MKKLRCKVCELDFIPTKESHYEAIKSGGMFIIPARFDAFDCPQCGCQIIVGERYKAVTQKGEDNEDQQVCESD